MSRTKAETVFPTGIAILAKAPLPGLAKTRLIPALGADGAAALQDWLLQRSVATALAAGLGPVSLWCAPDIQHAAFARCAAAGVTLHRQADGDLGQRMLDAIAASPTPATLVIGSDCPLLTPGHLRQAAASLGAHDATLIPAEDGGYVLIGLRRGDARVFADIAWSSERVMAQTRQRLAAIGWRWQEWPPLWDIDRPADVDRLRGFFPAVGEFGGAPA